MTKKEYLARVKACRLALLASDVTQTQIAERRGCTRNNVCLFFAGKSTSLPLLYLCEEIVRGLPAAVGSMDTGGQAASGTQAALGGGGDHA